jgi:hypothetical protein
VSIYNFYPLRLRISPSFLIFFADREFNQSTLTEWQRWEETGEIVSEVRSIMLLMVQIGQGTCLVDNIELYIFRGSGKKKKNGVGRMKVFEKYRSLKLRRSKRR